VGNPPVSQQDSCPGYLAARTRQAAEKVAFAGKREGHDFQSLRKTHDSYQGIALATFPAASPVVPLSR
jgi:hypothetical protein